MPAAFIEGQGFCRIVDFLPDRGNLGRAFQYWYQAQ
jgi:hypothetical protein